MNPIARRDKIKAVVFGGSGFVGSHVADALTAAGHEVIVFDLRKSAYLQEGQQFLEGDILHFDAVLSAMQGCQVVYNFAGASDIDMAWRQPVETLRLNLQGCVNLLEASRATGIERFVFASTIYVYSESGGFYRVSKQACELYVEEYFKQFGLSYTILRYGTLYGRRADERNSVHRYLKQALLERRIQAIGSGDEAREYIHVEDAARSSVDILVDEYANQHVIITGHTPMRYRDLVRMIREIVGGDVEIEFIDPMDARAKSHHNIQGHYNLTPYTFNPKIGKKLVSNFYMDMGQGILDCLDEIHRLHADARRDCTPPNA